jgi:hypothetical protein
MITASEYATAVISILRQRGYSDEEIRKGLLAMDKEGSSNAGN